MPPEKPKYTPEPHGNPFGPGTNYPPANPGTRIPAQQPHTPTPTHVGDQPYRTPNRWPTSPGKG
jgi:hypothetical protein